MDKNVLMYTPKELPQDPKCAQELSLSNYRKRAQGPVFTFVAHYWNLRLGTFDLIPAPHWADWETESGGEVSGQRREHPRFLASPGT